jgi:hypothetical protein
MPQSRVLLAKLIDTQLIKKFNAFYANLKFNYVIHNSPTIEHILSHLNPVLSHYKIQMWCI